MLYFGDIYRNYFQTSDEIVLVFAMPTAQTSFLELIF